MELQPLVSAIIPAHNAEATLGRAIESVLDQTYPLIEIIVVDDGSDDDTAKVAFSFGEKVTLVRQKNAGVAAARNRAIAESSGPLVANLDADDRWAPEKIHRQVQVMQSKPNIGALGTNRIRVRMGCPDKALAPREGKTTKIVFKQQLFRNHVCSASMMMRRDDLETHKGYDENLCGMEDYDLWLRFIASGLTVATLQEPLYYFYEHDQSLRSDCDLMHESLSRMIHKWETLLKDNAFCRESTFEDAFSWWLFKAATRYRQRGRDDLSQLALRQAMSRKSNWRLRTFVRSSNLIPCLMDAANRIRPMFLATG